VCYYKRWTICYLMRVRNVDDTRSIDDGKRDPHKYKLNGEFLKSEVPGVCATIRGGRSVTSCGSGMSMIRGALTMESVIGRK
jgi:hypothetical protein